MNSAPIAFVDLKSQRERIRSRIDAAIAAVMDHGIYIHGKEVGEFEAMLAEFTGAEHAMGCGNGTDALQLILMAEGVGPGDAVFIPALTFIATAEVAPLLGATPVIVDVLPNTFNMDPNSLEDAVTMAREMGLNPKIVIPVDLFGQPADYNSINTIAERHGLIVVADAAQSVGGSVGNIKVGKLATWTATSFFPSKPLGCYGDGGAVMTDDPTRAALIRSLQVHGKGENKYDNVRVGINSRLDTIQAAILKEKIAIFPCEIIARERIAKRYNAALFDIAAVPTLAGNIKSSWALYTGVFESRDEVMLKLKDAGISSVVYYSLPVNRQRGYLNYPVAPAGLPTADLLAGKVLSLPMHPYLDEQAQARVIDTVRSAVIG